MNNKIAIVTGGAQGIGRAIVDHFLKQGWRVAAWDKDGEAVDDLARLRVVHLLVLLPGVRQHRLRLPHRNVGGDKV